MTSPKKPSLTATTEKTDALPRPADPLTATTQPGSVPADVEPPFALDPSEDDPDAMTSEEILQALARKPMKPPAPRPIQRASSDGDRFVAHHGVMEPPAATATPVPQSRVIIESGLTPGQIELKALINASASEPDLAPESSRVPHVTTLAPNARRSRSRGWLYAAAGVTLGGLLALVFAASSSTTAQPPAGATWAPSATPPREPPAAVAPPPARSDALPEEPPATPAAPVLVPPSSAQVRSPMPARTPPRPSPRPAPVPASSAPATSAATPIPIDLELFPKDIK